MSDWKEIKLLCEHAVGFSDVSLAPDVVLALIAENESLRNTLRPLLSHWDDLKAGESINVDAARAAMGNGE